MGTIFADTRGDRCERECVLIFRMLRVPRVIADITEHGFNAHIFDIIINGNSDAVGHTKSLLTRNTTRYGLITHRQTLPRSA